MVQPAVGRKKHDDGEDDDFEVVGKGAVPHPPDFKFAFVGSDDGVVEVVAVAVYLIEDGFFVAEDDRGDAGEAWGDFVGGNSLIFVFRRKRPKGRIRGYLLKSNLPAGADHSHVMSFGRKP